MNLTCFWLLPSSILASFYAGGLEDNDNGHYGFFDDVANTFTRVNNALDNPSETSRQLIQNEIDAGGDVMEAIGFHLNNQCNLATLQYILEALPTVDGKISIPCRSHYGGLYSLCSYAKDEELLPWLHLVASVSALPPCSADLWNIVTKQRFWIFGLETVGMPGLNEAVRFLMDQGCPLDVPLLYKTYHEGFDDERLENALVTPSSQVGWFNICHHLLWNDPSLGEYYLTHSLGRLGASPNETIFSHTSFIGMDTAKTRSILGHVLEIFSDDWHYGVEYTIRLTAILIAFGARTEEFFTEDPNAIGADPLNVESQEIIQEAENRIEYSIYYIWLINQVYASEGIDIRREISKALLDTTL